MDEVCLAVQKLCEFYLVFSVSPPSTISVPLMRTSMGKSSPHFLRMFAMTSIVMRARFSRQPPYLSVLRLLSGERNWCSSHPCPAWIITISTPSELCHLRSVAEALNDIVYGLLVKLAVILAEMPRLGARSPDGPVVVFGVCACPDVSALPPQRRCAFYRVRRRVEIGGAPPGRPARCRACVKCRSSCRCGIHPCELSPLRLSLSLKDRGCSPPSDTRLSAGSRC